VVGPGHPSRAHRLRHGAAPVSHLVEPHEAEGAALLRGELTPSSATPDALRVAQRLLGEELARRGTDPIWRTRMMPPRWYDQLDTGIRFPVRVLHAAGLETCQSCQGGPDHAYPEPTVDLLGPGLSTGSAALAALEDYGLDVLGVALHWTVVGGLITERIWRVTFRRPYPERADDVPFFVHASRPF
jgi:hypothetical protein